MIKQGNVNMIRNTDTRSKTLDTSVIATATLMAMMSIVTSANEHSINARAAADGRSWWLWE